MKLFENVRPLLRIATALEAIAASLQYFAIEDARHNNRIFMTGKPKRYATDQSELLHTSDPATVAQSRQEELDTISNRGYRYLDEIESRDE